MKITKPSDIGIRTLEELHKWLFLVPDQYSDFLSKFLSPLKELKWVSSDGDKFLIELKSMKNPTEYFIYDLQWLLIQKISKWSTIVDPIIYNDTVLFDYRNGLTEIYDLKTWSVSILNKQSGFDDARPKSIGTIWRDKGMIIVIQEISGTKPLIRKKMVYWLDWQFIYEEPLKFWHIEERKNTMMILTKDAMYVKPIVNSNTNIKEYWVTLRIQRDAHKWFEFDPLFKIPDDIISLYWETSLCVDFDFNWTNSTNWDIFKVVFYNWKYSADHTSVIFNKKWDVLFIEWADNDNLFIIGGWILITKKKWGFELLTHNNLWIFDEIKFKQWKLVDINWTLYCSKFPMNRKLLWWEEMIKTYNLEEVIDLPDTKEVLIRWKRYKKSLALK